MSNGPSLNHNHPRSASTSVPDRRNLPKTQFLEPKKRNHQRAASGSNHLAPPQNAPASNNLSTSPHTAKDSFLHYFFGAQGAPGGPSGPGGTGLQGSGPTHASSAPGSSDGRTEKRHVRPPPYNNFASREILPDLASGRRQQPSRNYESGTTAYDMKSLGKHLEAGPVDQLHLSPREEMETNLIRSLIASYFGIVRQTIEDLVPKAIMHLLVRFFPHLSPHHDVTLSCHHIPPSCYLVSTPRYHHINFHTSEDLFPHSLPSQTHFTITITSSTNMTDIRSISQETPSNKDWSLLCTNQICSPICCLRMRR
jgi:hypothetical protein